MNQDNKASDFKYFLQAIIISLETTNVQLSIIMNGPKVSKNRLKEVLKDYEELTAILKNLKHGYCKN